MNNVLAADSAELKLRLAEAFGEDRDMYGTLKGLYIESILDVRCNRFSGGDDK